MPVAVHPVAGGYEPILDFMILGGLFLLRRMGVGAGWGFTFYVFSYAAVRGLLSLLRTDEAALAGVLSVPQLLAILTGAAAIWWHCLRRHRPAAVPTGSELERHTIVGSRREDWVVASVGAGAWSRPTQRLRARPRADVVVVGGDAFMGVAQRRVSSTRAGRGTSRSGVAEARLSWGNSWTRFWTSLSRLIACSAFFLGWLLPPPASARSAPGWVLCAGSTADRFEALVMQGVVGHAVGHDVLPDLG